MKLKALALVIAMSGAGQAFANTGAVDVYGKIVIAGSSSMPIIALSDTVPVLPNPDVIIVSGGNANTSSLGAPSLYSYAGGSVSYSYNTGSGTGSGYFSNYEDSSNGSLTSVDMASHGFGYDAQAYAEYGATHARASTTYSSTGGYSGGSYANASANYTDWFVITGGTGMAWASLTTSLDGTLAGGGGYANVSFEVNYLPGSFSCWSCDPSQSYQYVISDSQSINGRQTRTSASTSSGEFAFTYDQPFQLSTNLSVGASNGGWVDYFNTGSITGFILPAGASLSSGSGQFVTGVPEPETYAMMLAGLGLMGTVARRRENRG